MLDYRYRQYLERKKALTTLSSAFQSCVNPVAHIRRSVGFRSGRRAGQTRRHRRIIYKRSRRLIGTTLIQIYHIHTNSILDEQMYGKLYSSILVWDYTQKAYFATIISSFFAFPVLLFYNNLVSGF